jgi:hypothetical protein
MWLRPDQVMKYVARHRRRLYEARRRDFAIRDPAADEEIERLLYWLEGQSETGVKHDMGSHVIRRLDRFLRED